MTRTMLTLRKRPMAGVEQDGHDEAASLKPPADAIYEWEILIEAPFAFDFFKLVRALFRYPEANGDRVRRLRNKTRKRYYLEILAYNISLICLILVLIPFLMLAFSYIATLPFLLLRMGVSATGPRAMAVISGVGMVATLTVPVVLFLLMIRPTAYRDNYKRSKVELFHIAIALSLFLASGTLESLIASPALGLRDEFEGSTNSTMQWTLFFADKAMNVLFANLPNKLFGPLADIRVREGGSEIALGVLRTLLLFGFVALIRLLALKLCISKKELFYGSLADLRAYLALCGKAEARAVRKVIPLPEEEVVVVRNKYRPGEESPAPPTIEGAEAGVNELQSSDVRPGS